ncbi:MAG: hypothetical protein MUF21_08585 [Gemmatimonadaceae bacterium]|nr:hypothetical protein [Gemmatimonadaceae bacterium]
MAFAPPPAPLRDRHAPTGARRDVAYRAPGTAARAHDEAPVTDHLAPRTTGSRIASRVAPSRIESRIVTSRVTTRVTAHAAPCDARTGRVIAPRDARIAPALRLGIA